MKKIFVLLLLVFCIVFMVGCLPSTKLTINNTSDQDLELVYWDGYWFTNGEVWDNGTDSYISCLENGTSVTEVVEAGSNYVTFWLVDGGKYRTVNTVTVISGQTKTFTLTSSEVENAIQISAATSSQKLEAANLFK